MIAKIPQLAKNTNIFKSTGSFAMMVKAKELEAKGRQIIHFEIGAPDFPTPKNITQAGIQALRAGYTKYNPPLGILPLRQAIAKDISKTRKVKKISSDNIAVTPSGKTAIFTALSAIIEKNDEVMYPNPGFPVYETTIKFLGGKAIPIPVRESNDFSLDMSALEKRFSRKTKLIILNTPSNPTGGIIPREDLERIAQITRNTVCWIATDEIYDNIVYDKKAFGSFYSVAGIQDRTLLINGFSKTFSMTGWRIGYIAGPKRIMQKLDFLLTHIVGCTATFTQYAALQAVTGPKKDVSLMVSEFKKRRDYLIPALNSIPGVTCTTPVGAFYAFPNISSFNKSSSWMADYLLNKAGVAVLPGTDFGKYGKGYLRISFATNIKNLREGVKRIKTALTKL